MESGLRVRYAVGDVVGVRGAFSIPHSYGVIVSLPSALYPRYRVRTFTRDFDNFVELGATVEQLIPEPEATRMRRTHG